MPSPEQLADGSAKHRGCAQVSNGPLEIRAGSQLECGFAQRLPNPQRRVKGELVPHCQTTREGGGGRIAYPATAHLPIGSPKVELLT